MRARAAGESRPSARHATPIRPRRTGRLTRTSRRSSRVRRNVSGSTATPSPRGGEIGDDLRAARLQGDARVEPRFCAGLVQAGADAGARRQADQIVLGKRGQRHRRPPLEGGAGRGEAIVVHDIDVDVPTWR